MSRRRHSAHTYFKPRCETLEVRAMFAISPVASIDGSGNNLANPTWGAAGTDLLRTVSAAYSDGISTPAGAGLASARTISNLMAAQGDVDILNDRGLSAFVYAWGQFIDHDMDLTPSGKIAFNVAVPKGDPQFDPLGTGTQVISLNRSVTDPATGTSKTNPLQQVNTITSYLDGSMVYGSDAARAAALRTFSGGQLKTSAGNLLPLNTAGLANANDAHLVADNKLFLAGDVRANENVELSSLQTLFMREHNRQAALLAKLHPTWTDEQLYQGARQIVIAEIQSITFNEFLPALLGQGAIASYRGYNPNVNAGISTEFSTAAFRFGHSMVGNDVEFLDDNGNELQDEMSFSEVFFNPPVLQASGIDPILKYLASDLAQEVDSKVVEPLRNFLFGPPGSGGLDLASLNIQRGRDMGLASYNATRVAFGLPAVTSFAQISSDVAVQQALQKAYGTVDKVELWVGGLAEDHVRGGSLGVTFTKIIADQFQRLRDGDRFWFERQFSGIQLRQLENTSLSDIIQANTGVTNLQDNVFFFRTSISGQVASAVSVDRNRPSPGSTGLAGILVQLQDLDGNVLDSTRTARDGSYTFTQPDLGTYRVVILPPAGLLKNVPAGIQVAVTKGGAIRSVDFDVTLRIQLPGGPWDGSPNHNPPPGPRPR